MKKSILTGIATIFVLGFATAQEMGDLPEDAQTFLNKHFPNETITDFEKFDQVFNSRESDFVDMDDQEAYEVELSNGVVVEFGKDGTMTEMESTEDVAIPTHALPDMIEVYLKANYLDLDVVAYEIDGDDQEVSFDSGVDLEFDMDGRFMEED